MYKKAKNGVRMGLDPWDVFWVRNTKGSHIAEVFNGNWRVDHILKVTVGHTTMALFFKD